MKFYTSVAKGLKLKVRKFWGLIRTFVEVTGGKLDRGGGFLARAPIQNRVKEGIFDNTKIHGTAVFRKTFT